MAPISNLRGIGCMILATGSFIGNDICMKLAMADLPPLEVLFLRGVSGTLWSLIAIASMGLLRQLPLALNPWVVLRGLSEFVAVAGFGIALARVPLGDLTAIYQIAPLLVLVGAALIWGEAIGPLRYGLIGLGFAGAMLVAQPGSTATSPYALLGLLTAAGAAGRDLLTRRIPAGIPALIAAPMTVVVVMLCTGAATLMAETWVAPSQHHIGLMSLAGLLVIIGQLLMFLAFRLAATRAVAPFFYCFLIWAVLAGFAIFGEVPNAYALTGMALIITSGLAVLALERRGPQAVKA